MVQSVAPADAATFETALAHVLEMEGGWTNDPYDPGGPTNLGIILTEFAAYKGVALGPDTAADLTERLRHITLAEAREIYRRNYWDAAACDRLPAGVAFMHFDAAVNQGVGAAARMLQQAAGVAVDGGIGPQTLAAVAAADPVALLRRYADIRRQRYRSLATFWRFGRGWLSRVDQTLAQAAAIAAMTTKAPSTTTGERPMSDTQTAGQTGKWWGESMTIWGAVITGLATVLPALGPLIGIDITGELVRQLGDQLVQVVQALGGLAGTIAVIYGRARASTPLARRDVSLKL